MMDKTFLGAIEVALETIVVNNDTEGTGAAIDASDCSNIVFSVNYGESGDTLSGSVYHTLKIQKATDAAFTTPVDMAATELFDSTGTRSAATVVIDDAAEDGTVINIGAKVDPDYRYYRILNDVTGTHTNGTPIGAVAIKQGQTAIS